jgi:hypothetical protein
MKKQTELQKAMKIVTKHIKKDKEYREGWKANIAMSFYDEVRRSGEKYMSSVRLSRLANKAADSFLRMLTR